jgi:hypothetical protein
MAIQLPCPALSAGMICVDPFCGRTYDHPEANMTQQQQDRERLRHALAEVETALKPYDNSAAYAELVQFEIRLVAILSGDRE